MNLLFLMHTGTNSRSNFMDIVEGCRELGHHITILETSHLSQILLRSPEHEAATRADICQVIGMFIQENAIDLTVCMWGNAYYLLGLHEIQGQIVTFFDIVRSPLLQIWLDAPERANAGTIVPLFGTAAVRSPYIFNFINNEGTAAEMQNIFGFSNAIPAPYGTNPKVFRPHPEQKKEFDIMFSVGGGEGWLTPSPVMFEEVSRDQPDVQRVRMDLARGARTTLEALAASMDEASRPAVREVLERLLTMHLDNPHQPMIECLNALVREDARLGQGVTVLVQRSKTYADATAAIRSIDSFHRVFTFVYLARYFRCGLYGSADLSAWRCPVKSAGFVPYEEQGRFYSQAWLGLSVMRWQDEVGLHIKPFEIMASGAACLAAYRAGTDAIYVPDQEIVFFQSPAEARTKTAELLRDPERMARIAAAGRARTLRDHTWAVRMRTLLAVIDRLKPSAKN